MNVLHELIRTLDEIQWVIKPTLQRVKGDRKTKLFCLTVAILMFNGHSKVQWTLAILNFMILEW